MSVFSLDDSGIEHVGCALWPGGQGVEAGYWCATQMLGLDASGKYRSFGWCNMNMVACVAEKQQEKQKYQEGEVHKGIPGAQFDCNSQFQNHSQNHSQNCNRIEPIPRMILRMILRLEFGQYS